MKFIKPTRVVLLSGGPVMTAVPKPSMAGATEPTYVQCYWFDRDDELKSGLVPVAALKEI